MIRHLKSPAAFLLLAVASATQAQAAPPQAPAVEDSAARLAAECASCHALDSGGKQEWGPSLFGIVDRPMGAEAGYRYGPYLRAQRDAGATWDEAALRAWLVDSKAVAGASGARTKMPAQQLTDEQLDELIGYLRTLR